MAIIQICILSKIKIIATKMFQKRRDNLRPQRSLPIHPIKVPLPHPLSPTVPHLLETWLIVEGTDEDRYRHTHTDRPVILLRQTDKKAKIEIKKRI